MATEKTINTRIQLKYSTLAEWSDLSAEGKGGNLVLKSGEIGICAIPVTDPQKKVAQEDPPAIMFKVGDGTTAFKDLPWASALAADVYNWAKKSVPAVEDFGDIITAARSGLISADSVVKTLNELKGNVTIAAAEDETHIIVGKSRQTITLALKLSDAEKAALNSGINATKVTKYDGYEEKITAAKTQADKGVKDAAAAQATANAAVSTETFNSFKTENTKAINAAKKAGTDAQTAAEAAQTTADAALPKTEFNTFKNSNTLEIQAAKQAGLTASQNLENYKTTNDAAVSKNTTAISNLQQAMKSGITFKGKLDAKPAVTDYSNGDLIIVGSKEYILYDSGTKKEWIELGDEGSHLTKVTADGYYVPLTRTIAGKQLNANITADAMRTALNVADGATKVVESTVSGWGFTKNKGTVITVKMNGANKTTSAEGLVDLGTVITTHQDISGKQDKITATNKLSASLVSGLAAVATSGSYNDLADKPTIDNNNQKVKAGEVEFGANATVNIKAGTNVSVSGSATDGTITISGKSDSAINGLIDAKINNLDTTVKQPFKNSRTITKLTQTNGIIDALVEDINITASQVSDFATAAEKQIKTHTGVDKVGTVTSVSTPADSGLKVTNGSTTPSITIDPDVVFVFDCGSATVNV